VNRRGFFRGVAGVAAAAMLPARALVALLPAIPILYGDGIHDDTAALNVWGRGGQVKRPDGTAVGARLEGGRFLVSSTINISRTDDFAIINNWFQTTPEWQERLCREQGATLRACELAA
jgi:hypothetical protein